ncbi:MAG: HepT-like ribonuclease domain-containing protein [Opitutaceae bacterium]|jgi:uncharacterized protein with HEPN domain
MKPDARSQDAFLYDILKHAKAIQRYTTGVTPDGFWANEILRDAVAMRVAAIGEAARQINSTTERALPKVPFKEIRGMRNRIAHDYGGIDFREVWKVVEQNIEPLISSLDGYVEAKKQALDNIKTKS